MFKSFYPRMNYAYKMARTRLTCIILSQPKSLKNCFITISKLVNKNFPVGLEGTTHLSKRNPKGTSQEYVDALKKNVYW